MPKSSFSSGMSQRQLRVGEEIRRILSDAFTREEFYETALKGLVFTIPEVQVSPDLKHAKVYVYPVGGSSQKAGILEALGSQASKFRFHVAQKMTTKYSPRLHFCLDKAFEEAAKIEGLLRETRVARDLQGDLSDNLEQGGHQVL